MKKKITICMIAIMMVATAVVTIASCSKSDNNSGSTNSNSGDLSKIVGTWQGSNGSETITVTFNNDGRGTARITYNGYYGTEIETLSFTYSMTDSNHGTAIVAIPSYYYNNTYYYESYPLEINGPNLYVYEDNEYYGIEIIWMLTKV